MPNAAANDAVSAEEATTIDNVTASRASMVSTQDAGPPIVVRRLRSSSPSRHGIHVRGDAQVQVSDSLIRVSAESGGGGLWAETAGGSPSIVARHVTVVGTGDPVVAGRGAYANAYDPGETATVDVRDSIFHALSTDLDVGSSSGGVARIAIDHSNFDQAKVADTSVGDAQVVAGVANVLFNPGFVDGAASDFRLRPDSPLIDRGFPGEGSTADLDGQPRPNDGNGDGVAVRDIGAFEYQRPASPPPPPPADTSAPLFRILSKGLKLDRRRRVAVVLRGPANETAASSASLGLRSARRIGSGNAQSRRRIALGRKRFSLRPSARTVVRVKLSRKNARRVRAMKRLRVVLSVTARDAAGNSRTARKTVSLRAVRTRR